MTFRLSGRYRFWFPTLFTFFLSSGWALGDTDASSSADLSSNIITVGIAGFGLLLAYVVFLTAKFLIAAVKESARAKKEAAHSHPKDGSQMATSFALGAGFLFAALAVGVLFLTFLFVMTGFNNPAITQSFSALVITLGVGGAALFVLYLLYLPVRAFFKGQAHHPEPSTESLAAMPVSPEFTRRSFISLLGWAWITFTAAGLGALSTVLRFFFPNVTFEPAMKFKVGFPDQFSIGVDERNKDAHRVWIVRNEQGFYALSTICTHLGCTPNWLQAEQKFKCPCHGSGYYITGVNFEGPAPRPLERFQITLADDGQIQVDETVKFQQELGQWGLPGSFLEYNA